MKVSYNWLKEFVDFDTSPDELAHAITMAGSEVEVIETIEGDTVFDIGITPNRPDCLCIRGIAREISTILGLPLKDVKVDVDNTREPGPDITVASPDVCYRYSSRIITGVKPGPSPDWLVKRLEACGIRPTSNIVDVTNYVLLELGQPLHAFDLDKLAGKRIVVRQAGNIKTFTTLDNEERSLGKEMLMIWDSERPVAMAGVMGGLNTEVSDSTRNILLESAYFKPSSVRRTSKSLGLSTESSYRFERGVDIENVSTALDRAAAMIAELAGGEISGLTDVYPERYQPRLIPVTFERINSLIGVNLEPSYIEETLSSLGFKVSREGDIVNVTPPSYRRDVEREEDIVEEVARLYGYDNIPSTLPLMQMSPAPEHRTQNLVKSLKLSFSGAGYTEAINYSFINHDAIDKLALSDNDRRRNLLYVSNPLRQEESAMRTTLVPALLANLSLNLNRGEKELRFFEISKVFFTSQEKLPDEVLQAAAVYHKDKSQALWKRGHDGYYDLKGAVERVLSSLNIKNMSFVHTDTIEQPYLHPGKSCSIMIDDNNIGTIGVIHPGVAEAFDIAGDITIAEINDLHILLMHMPSKTLYTPLPKYPYVERDVSMLVHDDVTVSSVSKEMLDIKSDMIEEIRLFDIYKGTSIPSDKKSLAFSIRFRSTEKTLTDIEVDELYTRIIKKLKDNLGAELRS
ncbi:MAG: phenylalanine--tRNA ligase subunit beta [Nitrospiraceae bacterium]|nr:MAG: phenylalanine--tRNA ligase subunit beta [Nitrospiraceae bacterium]